MSNVFVPGSDPEAFLRRAIPRGYSMQEQLVPPHVGKAISDELDSAGYLVDYTELVPAQNLEERGLRMASLLHRSLNDILCGIEDDDKNHLPLFSVRVFSSGRYGTTIHRNDSTVGPWAIGITLAGSAPFNVYNQNQLPLYSTQPLFGDGSDPAPLASMETSPGSGWTLYTREQQVPHSSGFVNSETPRELLIFYGTQW